MKIAKITIVLLMMVAIALPCALTNVTMEPAVTQYYSAGFQIEFSNINSSNWGNEIDMFVLRAEDNIPIEEVYQDSANQVKYTIPDSGTYTTGLFSIGTKYVVGKSYILWVQACGGNVTVPFMVANQYGIADWLSGIMIWFVDNIFYIIIGLMFLAMIGGLIYWIWR